jgi:hypothetical protein
MAWYFRYVPRKAVQQGEETCWAAVMEAWLAETPNRPRRTQDELVQYYIYSGQTDSQMTTVARDALMDYTIPPQETGANGSVDPDFIADKLKNKGYVVLGFQLGDGTGHLVLVYGITNWIVAVMDPDGGQYYSATVASFQDDVWFIGWPK